MERMVIPRKAHAVPRLLPEVQRGHQWRRVLDGCLHEQRFPVYEGDAYYSIYAPQGVAVFIFHVVRHEENWGKLKRLFIAKIGKKRHDTQSTANRSATMNVGIYVLIHIQVELHCTME